MLPRYSISSSYLLITIEINLKRCCTFVAADESKQNIGHSPRVAQQFSQNGALHVQVCTKLLCWNYSVSSVLWLSPEFICNFYLLN